MRLVLSNKQSLLGHHSSRHSVVSVFKCPALQERHQEVEGLMKTISKQKARPPAAGAAWCSNIIGSWECHRAPFVLCPHSMHIKGRSLERTCTLKLLFGDLMRFDVIEEQADRWVMHGHAMSGYSANGHDNHHRYPLKTVLPCPPV